MRTILPREDFIKYYKHTPFVLYKNPFFLLIALGGILINIPMVKLLKNMTESEVLFASKVLIMILLQLYASFFLSKIMNYIIFFEYNHIRYLFRIIGISFASGTAAFLFVTIPSERNEIILFIYKLYTAWECILLCSLLPDYYSMREENRKLMIRAKLS